LNPGGRLLLLLLPLSEQACNHPHPCSRPCRSTTTSSSLLHVHGKSCICCCNPTLSYLLLLLLPPLLLLLLLLQKLICMNVQLRAILLLLLSYHHLLIFLLTQWLRGWKFLLNFMVMFTVKSIFTVLTFSGNLCTHAVIVSPVIIGVITSTIHLGNQTPRLALLLLLLLLLLLGLW
jgi:hypothetical protein